MLSVRKISSINADDYGKYLAGPERAVDVAGAEISSNRGDYYLGGDAPLLGADQKVGGAVWLGSDAARSEWGMQGAIDAEKLSRLMRGEHASQMVEISSSGSDGVAVTSAVPARVRVAGYALDPRAIRVSLMCAVIDQGGRGTLDPEVREAVDRALDGVDVDKHGRRSGVRLDGMLRGQDGLIRNLATPLEEAGLIDLSAHRQPIVNSQDMTFSAPKSVSLAWVAGSPHTKRLIEEAVLESSQRAVAYAVTTTNVVKIKDGGRCRYETSVGAVGASFIHHTARPSADRRPDPQLHVHNLIVGVQRRDGKLVTPDQGELVRHGREVGAFFRCQLASELEQLGFAIEHGTGKGGRYFEIAGIDQSAIDAFSGRSHEVDAHRSAFLSRYGRVPSQAEAADFAVRNRAAKTPETVAELVPAWQHELLHEHGISERYIGQLERSAAKQETRALVTSQQQVATMVLDRIEAASSMVRDREFRAITLEASAGLLNPIQANALVAAVVHYGHIVVLEDGRVTTARLRAVEGMVLAHSERIIAHPPIPDRIIGEAIIRTEQRKGFALSDEQRCAVQVGCSDAAVSGIVGVAGSGKGVAIATISEAARLDGRGVIAISTQGVRAIGAGAQANARGMSINQFAYRHWNGHEVPMTIGVDTDITTRSKLEAGDVILVDEAGMVDTHRYHELLRVAEDANAHVVLVGDPAQLSPIGAGGMYEPLLQAIPNADLHEIHRTDVQWLQEAQSAIRNDDAEKAVSVLRDHEALHMQHTHRQAMERMVGDWATWRHEHALTESLLIVHTNNRDVDHVNELCQLTRIRAGELEAASVPAPGKPYHLHAGEPVIFRDHAYRPEDGSPRIENGQRGVIESVDPTTHEIVVQITGGTHNSRSVSVNLNDMQGSDLRLMYASHVMPSQGETVERTSEVTGLWNTNKEAAYVGASRLQHRHDMYTSREALGMDGDDEERYQRLADLINKSAATQASITVNTERRRIDRLVEANPYEQAQRAYQLEAASHHANSERLIELREAIVRAAQEHTPSIVHHALGRRPADPELQNQHDTGARAVIETRLDLGHTSPTEVLPLPRQVDHSNREKVATARRIVADAQTQLARHSPRLEPTFDVRREHTRARARGGEALGR